ncbi:hypothetical protein Trydic_g4671 [Trypoxylus dichotomus]
MRRETLTARIVLLHNNARPHTAAQTRGLIIGFDWKKLDHPPYSPDLVPGDYYLFDIRRPSWTARTLARTMKYSDRE